jgi:hypothetical protein
MVLVSALAVVLIAASADPDRSWARIRAMPMDQRTKLLQSLQRFDLELSAEKQQAIRDLDRRISELAPDRQTEYLVVLRRYHNWFRHLPENRQDEVLSRPPTERMGLIRKLVSEYAVPKADTPQFLRIAEVGEFSPFELASLFKICQTASEAKLAEVEKIAAEPRRRETLFRLGESLGIPRETKPPGFDEEKSVATVEGLWRKTRPMLLLEDLPRKKADEAVRKKQDTRRKEILRRQAINFHLAKMEVRSVDPERLAQFVAALPSWVRSALDQFPPDEARRRLSLAYRLVFAYPDEFKTGRRPSGPAKVPPVVSPRGAPPSPAQRPPNSATNAPF